MHLADAPFAELIGALLCVVPCVVDMLLHGGVLSTDEPEVTEMQHMTTDLRKQMNTSHHRFPTSSSTVHMASHSPTMCAVLLVMLLLVDWWDITDVGVQELVGLEEVGRFIDSPAQELIGWCDMELDELGELDVLPDIGFHLAPPKASADADLDFDNRLVDDTTTQCGHDHCKTWTCLPAPGHWESWRQHTSGNATAPHSGGSGGYSAAFSMSVVGHRHSDRKGKYDLEVHRHAVKHYGLYEGLWHYDSIGLWLYEALSKGLYHRTCLSMIDSKLVIPNPPTHTAWWRLSLRDKSESRFGNHY
ncbi:hypothetical protein B0H10DRAFT_1964783 [Mycena sp. CBHHK59/15]|nr:hypothetical protein B0H10DRAFT_1964783 [Mycena sp. CBHHK59/15]